MSKVVHYFLLGLCSFLVLREIKKRTTYDVSRSDRNLDPTTCDNRAYGFDPNKPKSLGPNGWVNHSWGST